MLVIELLYNDPFQLLDKVKRAYLKDIYQGILFIEIDKQFLRSDVQNTGNVSVLGF
jgi:hypothetical protein